MNGKLNVFVASCAVLISAASFIATYIQADAAKKQTKVMTTPLIQFEHGNYNAKEKNQEVYFSINNVGIGPAILHSSTFIYKGKRYTDFPSYLNACCLKEGEKITTPMLTNSLKSVLIKGQSELNFLRFLLEPQTEAIWRKLDRERWNLDLSICYCSLLEECYETDKAFPLGKSVNSCN